MHFWFEPQALGEQDALDAATRAVHAALRDAEIELLPPRLRIDAPGMVVQQNPPPDNPQPGDYNGRAITRLGWRYSDLKCSSPGGRCR